jgi:hypothetical protein
VAVSKHLFLLDSSVWIRVFRRPPDRRIEQRVREVVRGRSAASNGVIRIELAAGAKSEREYLDTCETVDALTELPLRSTTVERACRLGYDLRRKGITASTPDLIIAASAMEHDAVLVHADADFDRIAANADLRVESFANAV